MFRSLIFISLFFSLFGFHTHAMIEINPNSKLIAAVLEVDGKVEIWINSRKHWNEERSLTDSYSADEKAEVDQVTDWLKLCSRAESQYELCRPGKSINGIKTVLMRVGVMIDPEFQAWAETEMKDL